jgi:hypothetical protein
MLSSVSTITQGPPMGSEFINTISITISRQNDAQSTKVCDPKKFFLDLGGQITIPPSKDED